MTRIVYLVLMAVLAFPVLAGSAESFTFGHNRSILIDSTPASIANSVAATVLASVNLPANSMGSNGMLELFVWTRWTNNSASSAQNPRINVSIGGQQVGGVNTITLSLAPNVTTHSLYCNIWIKNLNVTNAQNAVGATFLTDPTRQGSDRFPDAIDAAAYFATTIDTTIDNLITVTAQNALADPAYITFYDGLVVK